MIFSSFPIPSPTISPLVVTNPGIRDAKIAPVRPELSREVACSPFIKSKRSERKNLLKLPEQWPA